MWTEQYRPVSFDQVVNQDNVVNSLKQVLSTGNIPHMLFYGPQGVGKSSVVNALAHELFGPKYAKERIFEINASSDRGISFIRSKVKDIAQRKVSEIETVINNQQRTLPAIQIIVLEEADALTREAQAALRRIIEDYSAHTRLILCCNYPSQIITPILSRCARYKFNKMSQEAVVQQLNKICQSQSIEVQINDTNPLQLIAEACNSDMRKAVNMLQMCCQLSKYQNQNILSLQEVNTLLIIEGILNQQQLKSIINGIEQSNKQNIINICKQINQQNYNAIELMQKIFDYYLNQCQIGEQNNTFLIKLGQLYEQCGKYLGLGCQEKVVINKFIVGLKMIL